MLPIAIINKSLGNIDQDCNYVEVEHKNKYKSNAVVVVVMSRAAFLVTITSSGKSHQSGPWQQWQCYLTTLPYWTDTDHFP